MWGDLRAEVWLWELGTDWSLEELWIDDFCIDGLGLFKLEGPLLLESSSSSPLDIKKYSIRIRSRKCWDYHIIKT